MALRLEVPKPVADHHEQVVRAELTRRDAELTGYAVRCNELEAKTRQLAKRVEELEGSVLRRKTRRPWWRRAFS
jgi:hypothetical protein